MFRTISATPKSTSISRAPVIPRSSASASPTTRRASWGTSCFVNLPKVGDKMDDHQSFGTIEAVKAVSELYAPVAGEVVEVNASLESDPAAVNRDPYTEGWMIALRVKNPSDLDGLLSPGDYRSHIGE